MAVVYTVTFTVVQSTPPHLLIYGEKPDTMNHQQFGVEGWIYRRQHQRKDSDVKFDARAGPAVSRVYLSAIRLTSIVTFVWCPARGSNGYTECDFWEKSSPGDSSRQ